MTRREWIYTAAAGSLASAETKRPNVIVFLADDLGWHDVGFHGSRIRTPNIDRLAAEGVQFNQFYSFPLCSPTRAGFMTGRHPIRFGLAHSVVWPWSRSGMPPAEKTIANVFKEAGYQTAITGKWHLGHRDVRLLPQSRGFDHFYGHLNGAIDYFTHQRGDAPDWQRNGRTVNEPGYSTDLIAAEASRWIRERDRSRPFFLYVAWNAPHLPLQAPDELIQQYSGIRNPRRRTYSAMVDAMDRGVGQVLSAVEQEKIAGDTIILFFSDNGGPRGAGANNGRLRAGKGTVFEGGIRVPAVLHWQGRLKPGTTEQVATVLDLLPTLASAAGIPASAPQPFDGIDLWPRLSSGRSVEHEDLFFAVQAPRLPRQHALRLGDWKLVRIDEKELLFHLGSDPEEKNDVAAQHPDRVKDLGARMDKWIALQAPDEFVTGDRPPAGWRPPSDWSQAATQ